jgi:hypothetical protein
LLQDIAYNSELSDTMNDEGVVLTARSDNKLISENDDTFVMTIRGSQQNTSLNALDIDE